MEVVAYMERIAKVQRGDLTFPLATRVNNNLLKLLSIIQI